MHFKTRTWESSSTVCEPDNLCDPAVLVSAANSDPHIRNRRLSPGSGSCGGGGGGCISTDQPPRHLSSESDLINQTHNFSFRKEKERKGHQHKGRSLRRENQRRFSERPQKAIPKECWVQDGLSLLKPPPAFPVQDSPAKLQPAVSYASKVKAGAAVGALEEDRPAIGMLLQNQWGLSFISESRPIADGNTATDAKHPADLASVTVLTVQASEDIPLPAATINTKGTYAEFEEGNGKLLLSCRHLVEALNYHNKEWNALCNSQKKDPQKIVWFKNTHEQPA